LDDSSVVGNTDGVSRTLAIQPEGSDKISWKATTAINSSWLSLNPTSADAPGTLSLTLQPGALAEGAYGDTVVITPDGWEDRPVRIPVTFIVRQTPIRLAFTTQPVNTRAGSSITPAVQVTARDAAGKTVTTWNGSVTISIANNPAGGTISGTLTAAATSGVVRFANLSIDKSGSGYTLRAASGAVTTTSAAFSVTGKSASSTASSISASSGTIAASSGSSATTLVVTARDDQGTVLPGIPVVLTATGTANALAPAAGTTNAQGIFTSTLSSTKAEAKTISAMLEDVAVGQHPTVTVTPAAATVLRFGVQPSTTVAGATITPAVTVFAQDAFGNPASSFAGDVTVDIAGNLLTGAKLNGDKKIKAVNGVATFSNLSVTRPGNGYTLLGSAPSLAVVTSQPFNVTAF
jgi:hypothetical protein